MTNHCSIRQGTERLPLADERAMVSRCTEVQSGGRMIDTILTNTVLPRISEEHLALMVGHPLGGVGLGVNANNSSLELA